MGVSIRTYRGDDRQIEIDGQPEWVQTASDLSQLVHGVWKALDPELRVALVATAVPQTGDMFLLP